MNRDVGYPVIAMLSLTSLAALWILLNPAVVADPSKREAGKAAVAALPVIPKKPDAEAARQRALAVLSARDLFNAPEPADMASVRRLTTASVAPPVQLNPVQAVPRQPFRNTGISAPAQQPRAAAPQISAPAPVRQAVQPLAPLSIYVEPARPAPAPQYVQAPQPQPQQRFPLTLRGVFPNPQDGGRALLAIPDGRIVSTGLGGVIGGWQVLRIDPAAITLQARGGQIVELRMPGY